MQPARLLKVRESADALACSVPMVRKMIKAGTLPVVRVGRAVRIPAAAVEALVGAGGGLPAGLDATAIKGQVARLVKAEGLAGN